MNSGTSYVQGASDQPLIGATIGQMFDAMALEHAGREPLVVPHQKLRWSYHELRGGPSLVVSRGACAF